MKTTFNTHEMKAAVMTKFRAGVTFLVYTLALGFVVLELTSNFAEASIPPRDANLNIGLAQQIVNQVYQDTRSKGEVYAYEYMGGHDRTPHLCADECACLSKKFAVALSRSGFSTKTVLLRPTKNSMGIKMRGAKPSYGFLREATYDYHMVTAVRLIGGWRVVDPVATNTTTFIKFQDWQHLIETPVDMSVRAN